MKIRFVVYRLDRLLGLERAFVTLARSLVEGNEIEVVVLRHHVVKDVHDVLPGVTFRSGLGSVVGSVLTSPLSTGADVEIIVGLWACLLWPWSRMPSRIPRIMWEHSLVEGRPESRRLMAIARRNRRAYRRATRVVAVSSATKQMVGDLQMSDRVIVIPNAARELERGDVVPVSYTDGEVRLVAFHSLIPLKNGALSIRALRELPAHFHLTVCGDGPERPMLESLARELGVESRVTFAGHVADIRPYLASADVVVQPSKSETFSLTIYEAASFDVPVACLNFEVHREALAHYVVGVLCDENDPKMFALAITDALAMKADHAAFDAARNYRLRDLSESAIEQRWRDEISLLVAGGDGPRKA